MTVPMIEISGLKKTYSSNLHDNQTGNLVFSELDLKVFPGEFVSIYGPNGSGKSTLFRILMGIENFERGTVLVNGSPLNRNTTPRAIVFQEYDLFDWRSVFQNVEFGLKSTGKNQDERNSIAKRYIELLGLEGHEGKYPFQLSGGLKQRTAIARALAIEPELLLMDEPFAAISSQVRRSLQLLVSELFEQSDRTIMFITHDDEEAVLLSDRIFVFTSPPCRVMTELTIDLPRPRTLETRLMPEFAEYVERLRNQNEGVKLT